MSKFYQQVKEIANFADQVDITGTIESIKKNIDFSMCVVLH